MTNIRRKPFRGWMIVLFMAVSFAIGCVDRICQSFLSECVFLSFPIIVFGLAVMDF